jgi:prepilin-type N-terminal cleavage/methylation domain-containing protein
MSLMTNIIHSRSSPIGQSPRLIRHHALRQAFTMLEFIVAMVVLGIALTGLFPLQVMQSRVIESLEMRYTESGNQANIDAARNWNSPVMRGELASSDTIPREDYGNWYLIPADDSLARKLTCSASLSRQPPPTLTTTTSLVDDDDTSSMNYTEYGVGWAAGTATTVYDNDSRKHALQDPATGYYAEWIFTNVPAGRYYVMATWTESADLATNAQYVLYDGETICTPYPLPVNQQNTPGDATTTYEDRPWYKLKSQYFGSGTIKVRLNCNATGAVLADAVRIAPVTQILSLDKSFNTEEVTIKVKIPLTP